MTAANHQDPAWLDAMYNNRARVADSADYLQRWAAASAEVRSAGTGVLDIPYGDGPREMLDIYPGAADDAPVLVFIHGGYWRALDKRDHAFIAPVFNAAGVCVVMPSYALAPAVTIPQIVMQMVRAVAWTYANIARYGGNPAHITVAGHSAGGHLATMMLACEWQRHDPALPPDVARNALAISGLHDLDPIMRSPYLQKDLHLTPEQVAMASPARLPPPTHGALYTVTGGDESTEYIRQNRLIQQAWGAERVPVCEPVLGCNHFSVLDAFVNPDHRLHLLTGRLLGVDLA